MAFAPKTPEHHSSSSSSSSTSSSSSGGAKRVTTAVVGSVMAFASMCSKKASRVSKKLKPTPKPIALLEAHDQQSKVIIPPSPRAMMIEKPKQLLATISNKAMTLVHKKKSNKPFCDRDEDEDEEFNWGDGGVWQRSILMGDKCQPLDFSGVIYYDSHGKQTTEIPIRSPRASPLPSYLYNNNKAQPSC